MDAHVPRSVTVGLRMRGIDVLTAQEDGTAEWRDDGHLLERAGELRRVLVSQDADLLREATNRWHEGRDFWGVIYAHQLRNTIGGMVRDLALMAEATEPNEWRGKVAYLPIR